VKKVSKAEREKYRRTWQRELLGEIRHRRQLNLFRAARSGRSGEGLSVYTSDDGDLFPITVFKNKPVPRWRYTTQGMKVYAAVWVMQEVNDPCWAFTVTQPL
ncbi:MAG: hypothetical protein WCY11_09625, partial [Novosphingobium sp.]